MTIKLELERGPEPPYERCCFCRASTPYWIAVLDVACCQPCARRAHITDVPTKAEWMQRERIANHAIRDESWRSKGRKQS